jgi:purine-binding chemotaxis protein CheW
MSNDIKNQETQYVEFSLDNEEYAISINLVQEIIMPQKTTHIPKTPSFIEGVINLRGHIIPIIDGRKRFNIKVGDNTNETRIIILELNKHSVGLVVDSVSEVVNLNSENIEPSPIDMEGNDFILGIGKYKNKLLILLDPSNILDTKETEILHQTIKTAKNIIESQEIVISK